MQVSSGDAATDAEAASQRNELNICGSFTGTTKYRSSTSWTDNVATILNESGSTPQFDLMAKDKFAASGSALANIAGGFGAGTRMIPRCACHPSRGSLGDNVASAIVGRLRRPRIEPRNLGDLVPDR